MSPDLPPAPSRPWEPLEAPSPPDDERPEAGSPSPPASAPHATGSARPRSSRRLLVLVGLISALVGAAVSAGVAVVLDDDETIVARPPIATPAGVMDIDAILENVRESVVTIETNLDRGGLFSGAGSGVVLSEDGMVLTNDHVVSQADDIQVRLFDGEEHAASLVGSFPADDLAIIRLEGVEGLTPAELGNSDALTVGEPVIAIGNALNLDGQPTVTQGIVSALDRSISGEGPQGQTVSLDNLIQTDAAINRGNSGGPLVDASGQVVGLNTAIISDSQNIGFAIAIEPVRGKIDDLRSGQGEITGDMAFLGVATYAVDEASPADLERFDVSVEEGAIVASVEPDTAAEEAGLEVGDVVVGFDGDAIQSPEDLQEAVRAQEAGDEVQITVIRGGVEEEITATLRPRNE